LAVFEQFQPLFHNFMDGKTLIAAQNADGGWPYRAGTSWTEPTVLALLALGSGAESARDLAWLRTRQRGDGGWAPQLAVDQTTWVTSLAALLQPGSIGPAAHARAVGWLMHETGVESDFWFKLRQRMLGNRVESSSGWPWFPGTAAWVTPTALAVLALRKVQRRIPSPEVARRIALGQQYLMSHMCADGGWNHGSSRALGYDGASYPETTGTALVALAGVPDLSRSIAAAERHWRECRSAEGAAWLQLGWMAQGHPPRPWPVHVKPRNVRDSALCLLAEQAGKGQNAFVD